MSEELTNEELINKELLNEHLKKWEPFKIEFLDEKDKLYQLDSSIEHITAEYLIINAPKFRDEKYDLPVGSEVSMLFYRREGLLYAQTKILGTEPGYGSRLKISLPYNIGLFERRKSRRFRLKLKLEMEYYLNKNSPQKKVLNEITHDVSTLGLSYISETPFGKFHNIKCLVYLEDNFLNPVIADCMFVYSREIRIKNEIMYHNAFEFVKIAHDDLLRLQQKCYRKTII